MEGFLANQIISNDSILIQQLFSQSQYNFMKLKYQMTPPPPHEKYKKKGIRKPADSGYKWNFRYIKRYLEQSAVLKDLPLEKLTFVSSSELQSSASAEIPVQQSSSIIITNFVEVLLMLQNILIVNMALVYNASISKSIKYTENSFMISSLYREEGNQIKQE
ncbi:15931_t:CDS:2, partial [Dentiscutata heterogama]